MPISVMPRFSGIYQVNLQGDMEKFNKLPQYEQRLFAKLTIANRLGEKVGAKPIPESGFDKGRTVSTRVGPMLEDSDMTQIMEQRLGKKLNSFEGLHPNDRIVLTNDSDGDDVQALWGENLKTLSTDRVPDLLSLAGMYGEYIADGAGLEGFIQGYLHHARKSGRMKTANVEVEVVNNEPRVKNIEILA